MIPANMGFHHRYCVPIRKSWRINKRYDKRTIGNAAKMTPLANIGIRSVSYNNNILSILQYNEGVSNERSSHT